ncbi:CoA-binding protein, partial [Candidatus Dojkabacteria bacterium]|nr:CoA-binding protein [Candidatus Dojkabacteria bacterium]
MPQSKSNLYSPSAVAVIGASRDNEKIGTVILQNIINSGYKGRLFPVNPNANKILGLRSYKSVLD